MSTNQVDLLNQVDVQVRIMSKRRLGMKISMQNSNLLKPRVSACKWKKELNMLGIKSIIMEQIVSQLIMPKQKHVKCKTLEKI